ncbi:hypothetical protein B0T21DRAFT_380632 [Apiosordaria backusii]|uniref:Cupin type-2 domain-containing protein n=1 Tax=Apiosordaria backusii TaxID=314023 RepID=A0AA40ERQ9_9PEZI|nr:hypothetical protein B0T21DRAFT_380632 [Apiosordaria backusii]
MGDATSTPSSKPGQKDNGKLSPLPQPTTYITSHNSTGQAIVHSQNPFQWRPYDENNLAFAVPYTTSRFPPDLNNDADLKEHQSLISNPDKLGLVNPKGTVLRCVDFAPGYACGMHRTQSLDYGIVMEGEVDMVLDSGERYSLKRGDVAIQRATQHQWVNKSNTQWARMMFVLQDCQPLIVAGKEMGEDLGTNSGLPPSGN